MPPSAQLPSNPATFRTSLSLIPLRTLNHFNFYFLTPIQSALIFSPITSTPFTIFPFSQFMSLFPSSFVTLPNVDTIVRHFRFQVLVSSFSSTPVPRILYFPLFCSDYELQRGVSLKSFTSFVIGLLSSYYLIFL